MDTIRPDLTSEACRLIRQVLASGLMTLEEVKALIAEGRAKVAEELADEQAAAVAEAERILEEARG